MRRQAERLLEGPAEIVRTQADQPGESRKRYRLGKMFFDVARDDALLPACEATLRSRCAARRPPEETAPKSLLSGVKAGTKLRVYIDAKQIRFMDGKNVVATLVPSTVQEISYGQDVHRRIGAAIGLAVVSLGIGALMALTKSKKHYVGLTWAAGEVKGGFAMQCDKDDYRGVLAGLEGVTGKKAVNSDAMTVKN